MIVYCITNKYNRKCYVGWTKHSAQKRWQSHQRDARRNRSKWAFARAIRKYGAVAFSVKTLQRCSTLREVKRAEIYWIATLKSLAPRGYNLTAGGDGSKGRKLSVCARQQQSVAMKKLWSDPNFRSKQSNGCRKAWRTDVMYRKGQAAAQKRLWKDKDFLAKMSALQSSVQTAPRTRAKHVAAAKRLWRNPRYRAKHLGERGSYGKQKTATGPQADATA